MKYKGKQPGQEIELFVKKEYVCICEINEFQIDKKYGFRQRNKIEIFRKTVKCRKQFNFP
jgi:hypothetical protein